MALTLAFGLFSAIQLISLLIRREVIPCVAKKKSIIAIALKTKTTIIPKRRNIPIHILMGIRMKEKNTSIIMEKRNVAMVKTSTPILTMKKNTPTKVRNTRIIMKNADVTTNQLKRK